MQRFTLSHIHIYHEFNADIWNSIVVSSCRVSRIRLSRSLDEDARCDTLVHLRPICDTLTSIVPEPLILFALPQFHPPFAYSLPGAFFSQLFFTPHASHPYTPRSHSTFVLTAFLVNTAIICCIIQCTQ
ncbi:hypothetical protein BDR05DRAFT_496516 [Suillus weaverae]|nr:hypothetical protein BDR05DRAFT_496516 [Suillus weaverae]